MKDIKIKKWLFVLVFLLITILPGCSSKSNTITAKAEDKTQLTEVDKIKKAGKIVLGTSADWPPSEFHMEIDGKDTIVGSDISVAKEVAKDLGVDLEIKEMEFKGLLAALQTGKVDFVISGMAPTKERKQSVDFSNIYHKGDQGILIRSNEKNNIKTLYDLSGKTIGVQTGSMQVDMAKEQIKNANLKQLGKVSDLVLALKTKRVDAVLCGIEVGKSYSSKNEDISLMDIKLNADYNGVAVAVKKDSPNILAEINKTIDRLTKNNDIEKFITEAQGLADQD